MTMTGPTPPKSKRRWYQFSMRTLLLLLVLGAVVLGWFKFRVDRARRNRERVAAVEQVVDEIHNLGGRVDCAEYWMVEMLVVEIENEYRYEELRPASWIEELFDDPGGSDDPVRILKVSRVDLWGGDITDAGLEHLKGLTNLKELVLGNTSVTDAGLEQLKGLTNLSTLRIVSLRLTNVTDITDAGLEQLEGLTKLKELTLRSTNVTAAGVKKLQQALPNCKIYH